MWLAIVKKLNLINVTLLSKLSLSLFCFLAVTPEILLKLKSHDVASLLRNLLWLPISLRVKARVPSGVFKALDDPELLITSWTVFLLVPPLCLRSSCSNHSNFFVFLEHVRHVLISKSCYSLCQESSPPTLPISTCNFLIFFSIFLKIHFFNDSYRWLPSLKF